MAVTPKDISMNRIAPAFLILAASAASTVSAHEFWIEPLEYEIAPEGRLVADLVNGQEFEGPRIGYFPQRFTTFALFVGGAVAEVPGRTGDRPALNIGQTRDGLNVVAYTSTVNIVNYDDWETFMRFVSHKDLGDIAGRHAARGLTEDDRREAYTRFSKTLVAVGDGAGADLRTGLETEIVALTNPYTDDVSGGMRVQVFLGDEVRADTQVEVFARGADDAVDISMVRTDDEGIAVVPVEPGIEYMLDAVVIREPSDALAEETGALWETLWANLTFMVPAE